MHCWVVDGKPSGLLERDGLLLTKGFSVEKLSRSLLLGRVEKLSLLGCTM
jgi:hypothetical protein